MNAAGDKQGIGAQGGLGNPREIGRWARIYAQNRSLPLVAWFIMYVVVSLVIGAGSCLTVWAYLSGHMALFVVALLVSLAGCAACIYMSIPKWGGKRMEQLAKRLYAKEGQVAVASPQTAGRRRAGLLLVLGFGACIVVSGILGVLGYIPDKYMQPVSALYVVPFLVILNTLMRPAVGWPMMLWPALYALHAILIVAGAPILFTGKWGGLNMLLPTVGYGLLTALLSHVYSRFALQKVKRLARTGLPTADSQEEVR